MENGCSVKVSALKNKLESPAYLDKALNRLSEQIVYFFYSEWDNDSED